MASHTRPSIAVTPSGPYIITGFDTVVTVSGDTAAIKSNTSLCRCGYSKNKPFCDGAHGPYQFNKAPQLDTETATTKTYPGQVQIHYNPGICAHLEVCIRGLPNVFNNTRRPWILPDNADAVSVIDTVRRCPSGALTYTSELSSVPTSNDGPGKPKIRALKNGPLAVEGNVALEDIALASGGAQNRFTLCRCGASRAMPFCDGSHNDVGFTDE